MGAAPLVSIIIPHYRGKEWLFRCLESVFAEARPSREVIVVDNGSTDGSTEAAMAAFPRLRIVRSGTNLGYAGGCNLGMTFARGAYLLLLNDDAVLEKGCLTELVRTAETDVRIAAVQPKILSVEKPGFFDYAGAAGGMIDIFGYPFARGRLFFSLERDEGQYDVPADIFWASGTCCLLRRSAVEKIGGLDEAFFAHMEEIDLNWRFHLAGYRVVYAPAARVYHRGATTLPQDSPRKLYLNHRNNLLMLLKHYTWRTLAWVLPTRLIFEFMALIYALVRREWAQGLAIVRAMGAVPAFAWHVVRERHRSRRIRTISDREIQKLMYRGSIVLDYFVRGRKNYRSLHLAG